MSNALMILIARKKDEAEVISKELAKTRASLEIARNKFRMLKDYQIECGSNANQLLQVNALSSHDFRNQFAFSGKIQDAINQQSQEILLIEKVIDEQNIQYQKTLLEIRKFEAVIERKTLIQLKKLNRAEQKQNDEFAARMKLHSSKNY